MDWSILASPTNTFLSECGLGPNVEVRLLGDDGPFYPIKNGIKTEDDVQGVLGIQ